MIVVILAFVVATLLTLAVVPLLARFARVVGLLDMPDNKRKLHRQPIPLVGGLAIFLAATVTASCCIYWGLAHSLYFSELSEYLLSWIPVNFERRRIRMHPDDYVELLGLLTGCCVIVLVGVLDDRFAIRGRQKLLGQVIASTVLIACGYHFEKVSMAGYEFKLDTFSVIFVYGWMLAATNSVNLLDGADGVAATIGIVMSVAMAAMAVFQGQMVDAIIAIAVTGGLLGFLRYNFPPAKVYLGDTGSMLLGFVLGALAIRCTFKQNSAFAFFAPLALLAIPLIDTTAAIVRRRLTGRSIFSVDRGHLHHSLSKRGYGPRVSLIWVGLLCATTAAGGVLSLVFEEAEYAIVSIVIACVVMLFSRVFGNAELELVSRKARSLSRSLFKINLDRFVPDDKKEAVHVQGSGDWQAAWYKLRDFAQERGIIVLILDLNAPWLHESFHATWKRSDVSRGGNHEWYAQVPLVAEGRFFGRIEIIHPGGEAVSHRETILATMELGKELESQMAELTKAAEEAAEDVGIDSQGEAPEPQQEFASHES